MNANTQQQIFDRWLAKHRGIFLKIVRVYAFTPEHEQDLYQELCIQVWRSIPNFKGKAAESTWIYRVALNTAIRWVAKEKKHLHGRQSLEADLALPDDGQQLQNERLRWLYAAIRQLNETSRSIALLLLEGFSYQEIADMIGITESLVGVRIHRIKKQLIAQSEKLMNHEI